MAQHPVVMGAEFQDRLARADIALIRPEFDCDFTERLEGMRKEQNLAGRVDRRALVRG
jgi:hypothetical protein